MAMYEDLLASAMNQAPEVDESTDESEDTSQEEGMLSSQESASEEVVESEVQEQPAKKESEDVEEIDVDGNPVRINYKDKESIKKTFETAARLQNIQREVARQQQLVASLKEKHVALSKVGDQWETARSRLGEGGATGVDALLEYLVPMEDIDAYREAIIQRQIALDSMSPEAASVERRREELDKKERLTAYAAERKAKEEKVVQQAQMEREQETFGAIVHPAFYKHGMNGKLGDPIFEEHLNKGIWSASMERCQELTEAGKDLTPQVVDAIFKEVASIYTKHLKESGTREAKKAVDKAKDSAKVKVAAAVSTGGGKAKKDLESLAEGGGSMSDMLMRMVGLRK